MANMWFEMFNSALESQLHNKNKSGSRQTKFATKLKLFLKSHPDKQLKLLTTSFTNKLRSLCKSILKKDIPLKTSGLECMLLKSVQTLTEPTQQEIMFDRKHNFAWFITNGHEILKQKRFHQLSISICHFITMSDLVNKLQVINPTVINNLLKLLQENASMQRLKSQLTDEELYKIEKRWINTKQAIRFKTYTETP